jgi:hypothetical protein
MNMVPLHLDGLGSECFTMCFFERAILMTQGARLSMRRA